MNDKTFDAFAKTVGRRGIIAGIGATIGGLAVGRSVAAADTLACNSDEKCEARCGFEDAFCCNGACIRGGCGPDRNLNRRTCKCERRTASGRIRTSAPKFCGA